MEIVDLVQSASRAAHQPVVPARAMSLQQPRGIGRSWCHDCAAGSCAIRGSGCRRAISDSSAVRSANEERETLPVTSDEKRGAADSTAAQAVAAALRVSATGDTVTASGPRPRLRSGKNSAYC